MLSTFGFIDDAVMFAHTGQELQATRKGRILEMTQPGQHRFDIAGVY